MAVCKVVRVENILEQDGNDGIKKLTDDVNKPNIFSSSASTVSNSYTAVSQSVCPEHPTEWTEDSSDKLTTISEPLDGCFVLPHSQYHLALSTRPSSCLLSMSRLQCVRKAVSHLELIQNMIDQWFGSNHAFLDVQVDQSREFNPDVCVPYLGAEDVVKEVLSLLVRLETDRQATLHRYQAEVDVGEKLVSKIDALCLRRLTELPLLVQKEHESCIIDLNELNWHVMYTRRVLSKAQARKYTAELVNNRLRADISFVKNHVPLVEEKLALELEAMDRINRAQITTNQELSAAQQCHEKTEQKSAEANGKAKMERIQIRYELDTVRSKLAHVRKELSDARETYSTYSSQLDNVLSQLKGDAADLDVLTTEQKESQDRESLQADKVRKLHSAIVDAEFEGHRLDQENSEADEKFKAMMMKVTAHVTELEQKVNVLEHKRFSISHKNDGLRIDIEDLEERITDCVRQKVMDEKNIQRILREQDRVAMHMQMTMEEHKSLTEVCQGIREQLTSDRQAAYDIEESLKNTAALLQTQLKEEKHSKTVLQARIQSDGEEIVKVNAESSRMKEKALRLSKEVSSAVDDVLMKVNKLRSMKASKDMEKEELRHQVDASERCDVDTSTRFEEQLSDLLPRHACLKKEVVDLRKTIENLDHESNVMNSRIAEMDADQSMLKRMVAKNETAVFSLTEDLEELMRQYASAKRIRDELKRQLCCIAGRISDGLSRHSTFIAERNAVLSKQEVDREQSLLRNRDLASRYRALQAEFLMTKEKLLQTFDERQRLECRIGDLKQVGALHSKMNGSLVEYIRLSGIFNDGELIRFEQISSNNGNLTGRLQSDMDEALRIITHFLQTQMLQIPTRRSGILADNADVSNIGKRHADRSLPQPSLGVVGAN